MGGEASAVCASVDVSVLHVSPAGRANVVIGQGDDKMADKVDIASEKARDEFLDRVQNRFAGIGDQERRAIEAKLIDTLEGSGKAPEAGTNEIEQPDSAHLLAEMPEDVRQEAEEMLEDPMLLKRVINDVARLGVAGERELVAAIHLVGTSRLLDQPLAAIIRGPSSSGKSYVIDKTAKLFPPEAVIHATTMTPQALVHMPPGSLTHRFIVAGERSRVQNDETAETTRALREMLSSGTLSKLMPVKADGGRIETVTIEQDGPIAYVESTTQARIFDEDANRCLLLHTDERPEQTHRVVRRLAEEACGGTDQGKSERIIQRHHAMQRMLEPLPVVVPYAGRLGDLLSSGRVELRRAFPQLVSMIRVVALLHQRQRKRDEDGQLLAAMEDYQVARRLLARLMARLLGGGISEPAQRFHGRLKEQSNEEFTTTEATRHERTRVGDRTVRGWLSELRDAGIVEVVEPGRGPKPTTWRLTDKSPESLDCPALPTVEQLFPEESFQPSSSPYPLGGERDKSAIREIAGILPGGR